MESRNDRSEIRRTQCSVCGASSILEDLFLVGSQPVLGNDKICVTCAQYENRASNTARSIAGSVALTMFWGGALTRTVEGTALFMIAFPVLTFLGIVIHELGHAVAARLVGARVVALSFGSGLRMKVVRRKGRFYLFGLRPIEGMTLISDVPKDGYRWRMILIFFAGPAVNIATALMAWQVYQTTQFTSDITELLVFFLIIVNALMGVTNLFPFGTTNQFGASASDGRQILAHLYMSSDDIDLAKEQVQIGEAYLEWLHGDTERAARLLEHELARTPLDPSVAITGSAIMLDLKRYAEGIALCERALAQETSVEFRAVLENNLACLLFERDCEPDLARIDKLTRSAMDVMPVMLAVRATRGAYFLKAGEYTEAVKLLDDERYVLESRQTQGRVSADLALALVQLGNREDAREALDRATKLYPENDALPDVEDAMQRLVTTNQSL